MSTLEIITVLAVPVLVVVIAASGAIEAVLTRMSRARADALVTGRDTNSHEGAESKVLLRERAQAETVVELVEKRVLALAPLWLVSALAMTGLATLIAVVSWIRWGAAGALIAFGAQAAVVYIAGVLVPRALSLSDLDRFALRMARTAKTVDRSVGLLLLPLLRLVGRNTEGDDDTFEAAPVSEGELLALTELAAEDEAIAAEEQQLIESVLEFGDTKVRSVMVPRPDMATIGSDKRIIDALALVVDHGFSRIPVVGSGIDDITGIAHAKDLIAAHLAGNGEGLVSEVSRTPHHVPETKHVNKLQREMQAEMFHMAIVVDEYGGTAGLVTLEDLLEELVGEIVDEFDVEEPMIEVLTDGARVNGKVTLSDLESLVGVRLPEGEWSTVGGLIFGTLGHVPETGERIELEGHRLIVERVQGRRIARVHLSRIDPAGGPVEGSDSPTTTSADDAGMELAPVGDASDSGSEPTSAIEDTSARV